MEPTADEQRLREIQRRLAALRAAGSGEVLFQIRHDALVKLEAILRNRVQKRSAAA